MISKQIISLSLEHGKRKKGVTDLKNPRKTWVKTQHWQDNQGQKLEAREKKKRRVFLNYHEYEIIYYTVLKKKIVPSFSVVKPVSHRMSLLWEWPCQWLSIPLWGTIRILTEAWRSYQTLTLTLTFCAQFPPLPSPPHVLQEESCFRVYITQLLLCNILPQSVIKTKTIHYLTQFSWLRNLGVA